MKALVNKKYLLEKYPGKGGWTFAAIPEVLQNPKAPFGWVRVKGTIDGVSIEKYKLMPMGNGKLFLPVKAGIRKKINKKEGDWVHVILFEDKESIITPDEMMDCITDSTQAFEFYKTLKDGEKKAFIDWVYSAKKEETKIARMSEIIEKMINKQKLY